VINSSKAGDIVADLFGGSGSTLIACERRNRKSRLMEIDPKYADCIVRRWEAYTGKHAMLEARLRPSRRPRASGGRRQHESNVAVARWRRSSVRYSNRHPDLEGRWAVTRNS
jgi:DNA methylase